MIATHHTASLEVGDSIAGGVSGSIVKRRYGLSASLGASGQHTAFARRSPLDLSSIFSDDSTGIGRDRRAQCLLVGSGSVCISRF